MDRRGRNNNNNNWRNFLNVPTERRLLVIFAGFVFVGAIHHMVLLRDHLDATKFIDTTEVRDDPVSSRVNIHRRAERDEASATKMEPGTVMTALEYLKTTGIGGEPEEEKPGDGEEDNGRNADDKEEESGDGDEAEPGSSGEEENGEEPEEDKAAEEKKKRKRYKEPKQCEKKEKRKRLNVAFFYADDWTMKVLGKFDKRVKTPNIDAMAENGMIFTNNCVTTSVCWASRATLATGTYLGVHKHVFPFDEAKFEDDNWSDTLYPLMKKGSGSSGPPCRDGYFTGLFGKWHDLEIDNQLREAFDDRDVYYGDHWIDRNGEKIHITEANKKDSIKFLSDWQEKFGDKEDKPPFFLTTSFFATHARDGEIPSYEPQNSTRKWIYPDSMEIPVPKTATEEHYQQLPEFLIKGNNEGRTRWLNRFEPKDFQKNIKDMYAMATEVDAAIGAIIDKIKSLGAYEDTILIFTTDNGNMHGEHGLAEKWYPFEEALRVPLVIQDPRMPKNRRGTMSDAWTLNVDLAPTILGAANIPPSHFMQGRDIADLYLNKDDDQASLSVDEMKENVKWRKDWFYEFNMGKMNNGTDHPWPMYIDASFALVNDEWKYVYWPQHNYEQLFHRSVDPFDEWDLLNKVFRPKATAQDTVTADGATESRKVKGIDNKNGCCDTVQTTMKMYKEMKERYAFLKEQAQGGKRI